VITTVTCVPIFDVSRDTSRSVEQAWDRVTDWAAHGQFVPLTDVEVRTPGPNGVGTVFNGRTHLGRFGFDDPMEVTEWRPPVDGSSGHCRIEKRGSVMHGWAELTVEPLPTGARVTWREDIALARAPRFLDGPTLASSRRMFGRLLRRLLPD
jgi:hypothetical protein